MAGRFTARSGSSEGRGTEQREEPCRQPSWWRPPLPLDIPVSVNRRNRYHAGTATDSYPLNLIECKDNYPVNFKFRIYLLASGRNHIFHK